MSKYEIRDRRDKSTALDPEISYDVVLEDIEATQTAWLAYKRLHSPKLPPVHHDWSWVEKISTATNHSFVTLKYAGDTHGMMMIGLEPQPCRLAESAHKSLLYAEYLETAPWNQRPYAAGEIRFLGVGGCLIGVAIDLSIAFGCGGRLGLHSLPEAKGFYEFRGFQNLGEDSLEKLDYLELGDEAFGNRDTR